jgi:cytochrome oxidase Cu insertion factor (SCO1/SenC/PrrC family)
VSATPALRRSILVGLTTLVAAAAVGVTAWVSLGPRRAGTNPASPEALGLYGEVPDFSLVERSGRRVGRSDLLGTVWIATFIYTECAETCPLQSSGLARLQSEFTGEADLRLVSITVDPERDTPAALSRYAERYKADPGRWLFLTGDKGAIYRLAKEGFRLGVADPGDESPAIGFPPKPAAAWASHGSKGLVLHSPRLVVVDRQARIRAYHRPDDEASLGRLRQNVRRVLREAVEGDRQ